MELHPLPFELILRAAGDNGVLKGKTIGVDATDLEANASVKSSVRKANGDSGQAAERIGRSNLHPGTDAAARPTFDRQLGTS